VLHLTDLAGHQHDPDRARTLNELADRASNTFRRQMLALREYRRPHRAADPLTTIRQANIAQQQIVQNLERTQDENATSEQGCTCEASSHEQMATKLPASPQTTTIAEEV